LLFDELVRALLAFLLGMVFLALVSLGCALVIFTANHL